MVESVFDDTPRTDARPARHDEGRFAFLNRSASVYFGHVRQLVEEWFSNVPLEHQPGLRGDLRADGDQFSAAFWELYLHEAYLRSGFNIEIHPEIPGTSTRPDFCLGKDGGSFYLEAVSVGRDRKEIAEDKRLSQVHRVLADMKIKDYSLALSTYGIGPDSLATRRLRACLRVWLDKLDPDEVVAVAESSPDSGFACLPEFVWDDAGWSLVFHAVPLGDWARGVERSALGVMGAGEATIVDNVTGIRHVLESKRGKYGRLDAPLVIAIQSNTEIPTRDFELESALYGASSHRPADRAGFSGRLIEEGFWVAENGWRNAQIPQVLTAYDLYPWTVAKVLPRIWSTLEQGISLLNQPDWLATMMIDARSSPGHASSVAEHLGLANDWPAAGDPDFDLS